MISSDGYISKYEPTKEYLRAHPRGKGNIVQIGIFSSIEECWVKQIRKFLSKYNIKTSMPKPSKLGKTTKTFDNEKPLYALKLRKWNGGVNQHQTLRDNIEYWNLTDLIMDRKYETLCEFTEPLSDENKALYTKPLTAKEFLEL